MLLNNVLVILGTHIIPAQKSQSLRDLMSYITLLTKYSVAVFTQDATSTVPFIFVPVFLKRI